MNIILVLGQTPSPAGDIDSRLREKMTRAIQLMERDPSALLVIAGGPTRRDQLTEAEGAMTLVPNYLKTRVRLETQSLSTKQNILFTMELLCDLTITSILVLSIPAHERAVRRLFKREWPEVMPVFLFEGVGRDTLAQIFEYSILHLLRMMDPNEKFFVPFKKWLMMS